MGNAISVTRVWSIHTKTQPVGRRQPMTSLPACPQYKGRRKNTSSTSFVFTDCFVWSVHFEERGAAVCFPGFGTHRCRDTEENEIVGFTVRSGGWVRERAFLFCTCQHKNEGELLRSEWEVKAKAKNCCVHFNRLISICPLEASPDQIVLVGRSPAHIGYFWHT